MRSVTPPPKGGRRIPAPLCEVPGCTETTRERKPYCTKHVAEHGYVRSLLETIESIENEVEATRKLGCRAVDITGPTANDLLGFVRENGPRSVPRLGRDLNLPVKVVKSYVTALARAGRIVTKRTERGVIRVELTPAAANPTAEVLRRARVRAG